MDLSTEYLGLKLDNPLMLGASPVVDDLDAVRRAEDAGVGAIVMHSLFEEQFDSERLVREHLDAHSESFGEALSYLPAANEFVLTPERYLKQVRDVKAAVSVPVHRDTAAAPPPRAYVSVPVPMACLWTCGSNRSPCP